MGKVEDRRGDIAVEVFEISFGGGLLCWMMESDEKWCCGLFCHFLTHSSFWPFWMSSHFFGKMLTQFTCLRTIIDTLI